MAESGYMLLGERLRNAKEKEIVKSAIEESCNRKMKLNNVTTINRAKIIDNELYGYINSHWSLEYLNKIKNELISNVDGIKSLSLSKTIKRLFVLIFHCIKNKEPVKSS